MFGSFPIIPRIYPTPLLFMMKQKWHNTLSWKNAVNDAFLIIYIVPETTFQYFVFIVLHTCCGSGYKMQLWSMSMWFHSDTSSTLRLEEERGSRHSNKYFSLTSTFAMLLKYQPTKTLMFTVSQPTKKENTLGAKSEHWWVSSRSRAAAENANFCWKFGARECLYIILSFQHLRASLAASGPSYLQGDLCVASRDWDVNNSSEVYLCFPSHTHFP